MYDKIIKETTDMDVVDVLKLRVDEILEDDGANFLLITQDVDTCTTRVLAASDLAAMTLYIAAGSIMDTIAERVLSEDRGDDDGSDSPSVSQSAN